jgi:hypothetical protein
MRFDGPNVSTRPTFKAEWPSLRSCTMSATTIDVAPHVSALTDFRSELASWLQGRLRDPSSRITSVNVQSFKGDDRNAEEMQIEVGYAIPGDGPALIGFRLEVE